MGTDVIMGAACTSSDDLVERLRFLQNAIGPVPSPFDCFLVNRSLKTLKIRMEEHQKNALIVGKWLEKHPSVISVRHPGLPSHPQHELVKRQCYGHSGMMSFYLMGGYESLAELPYLMTHASIEEKERVALGVTNNLIRISVGLENGQDIVADIDQALKAACN